MTDSVHDVLMEVESSFDQINQNVQVETNKIARWLMLYRVEFKRCEAIFRKAIDSTPQKHSFHMMQVAISQIEELVNDFEILCQGEVGGGLAHVHAVMAFAKEASALEDHHLTDPEVRRQVLAMTSGKCTYCEIPVSDAPVPGVSVKMFVEHVVPASKGGPNNIANYVPSCGSCNSAKGDRHVLHFVRKVQPYRERAAVVVPITEAAE